MGQHKISNTLKTTREAGEKGRGQTTPRAWLLFVYLLRASAKSDGLPATAPSLIIPAVRCAHPRRRRRKMTNLINGERKARLSGIIKGFIRETRCQFLPRVCLLIRCAQLSLHKELEIGSFEDCNG